MRKLEPVDIVEFNKNTVESIILSEHTVAEFGAKPANETTSFKFLSIFKVVFYYFLRIIYANFISIQWETRKGWDVLFESYFKAFFHKKGEVSLYILTQPYHEEPNYVKHIKNFIEDKLPDFGTDLENFPHVAFLDYPLPQTKLPRVYK